MRCAAASSPETATLANVLANRGVTSPLSRRAAAVRGRPSSWASAAAWGPATSCGSSRIGARTARTGHVLRPYHARPAGRAGAGDVDGRHRVLHAGHRARERTWRAVLRRIVVDGRRTGAGRRSSTSRAVARGSCWTTASTGGRADRSVAVGGPPKLRQRGCGGRPVRGRGHAGGPRDGDVGLGRQPGWVPRNNDRVQRRHRGRPRSRPADPAARQPAGADNAALPGARGARRGHVHDGRHRRRRVAAGHRSRRGYRSGPLRGRCRCWRDVPGRVHGRPGAGARPRSARR